MSVLGQDQGQGPGQGPGDQGQQGGNKDEDDEGDEDGGKGGRGGFSICEIMAEVQWWFLGDCTTDSPCGEVEGVSPWASQAGSGAPFVVGKRINGAPVKTALVKSKGRWQTLPYHPKMAPVTREFFPRRAAPKLRLL